MRLVNQTVTKSPVFNVTILAQLLFRRFLLRQDLLLILERMKRTHTPDCLRGVRIKEIRIYYQHCIKVMIYSPL